ncbi:MAG: replication protein RepA [Rhodospirillaceae bacterium]
MTLPIINRPRQLSPHQLTLALDLPVDRGERIDASFLHRSFCASGLPLRNIKTAQPGDVPVFMRTDDTFALTVSGRKFALPGGDEVVVGVPYGPKARLLICWMTTEIWTGRTAGRWLEIGRIKPWLESIGIPSNTKSVSATKDQLIRLAFSDFTFVLKTEGLDLFRGDRLIESAAFEDGDLAHYSHGDLDKVRWLQGLEVTEKAFRRFSTDAIPVPTDRLAQISHNAMAIDIFLYLCYRLPLIGRGDSELVTWRRLAAQFGSGGVALSKFRETFTESIRAALRAYPEANVAFDPGDAKCPGLVLRYSDPAELRKAFVVKVPIIEPADSRKPRLRNRVPSAREIPMAP